MIDSLCIVQNQYNKDFFTIPSYFEFWASFMVKMLSTDKLKLANFRVGT